MKLLLVYNPHAGNGRARTILPQITQFLESRGVSLTLRLTESSGHASQIVADENLIHYNGVIASGGDGTLYEVLNGYMTHSAETRPPLGLIPNGTGNAFMKELGLQRSDWTRAIEIILSGKSKSLDVGEFICSGESRFFINMIGMGFVTEVALAAIPLKWMGNAAYTAATLKKLINLQAQTYQLEIDDQLVTRQGIFVEVANSQYTGTSFLMAPKAKLDDGLLDIVLLNSISRIKLLRLFTSIYDGSHVRYPEIEYFQARKIRVIEQNPGQLIPDGEVLGHSPVEIICHPQAIQFFWPNENLSVLSD